MRWIWLTMLLAGCASPPAYSPQYYVDYRAGRIEQTNRQAMSGPYAKAPWSVINAYAECSTDYMLSFLTPADRAKLDAFAHQDQPLTQADYDAIDARARAAGASDITYENLDRLSGTCPDKVPLFKQYFRAS